MKNLIIRSLVLFLVSTSLMAQPGSIDNSFGNNGKVTAGFGRSEARANAIAIQLDGKIISAGSAYNANTTREFEGDSYNAVLYRHNTDGSLDSSFGDNGRVVNKIETTNNEFRIYTVIYYIKVQDDGKILTYGLRGVNVLWGNLLICRYNSDGSIDTTFGNNGFVDSAISPNSFGTPLVVQSDNKIVVLGGQYQSSTNANQNFATFFMERYNENGIIDDSFGTNGQVFTTFGAQLNYPGNLALQSDGKIVASGTRNGPLVLARYNTNGSLDTTFDGDGKVITPFGISNNSMYLTVLPNGKIQSVGNTTTSSGTNFAITQYNSNGSLDNTFDGDGRTLSLYDPNDDSYFISSVAKQSDGKFLVSTTTMYVAELINLEDFVIRRYNADGTVDASFGINGKVTTDLMEESQTSRAVIEQEDGKILLAGFSGFWNFNVLRYTNNGALDNSFSEDGIISEKIESSNDNGRIVLLQNDGKILLIGLQKYNVINTIGSADIAMSRYLEDGTLDSSFGVNGKSISAFGQNVNNVRKAALQPDGKILVLNESYIFNSTNGQEVIRFNTDGSLDESFGTNGKIAVSTSFFSSLTALKVKEDGSFFVINKGLSPIDNSEPFAIYLTSFNSDGSLNVSFGSGGTSYLEGIFFEGPDPEIVIQPDGKIIISTYSQGEDIGFEGVKLTRFNSDGTIDTSFENEVFSVDAALSPYALFLEPDGKIIVAGVSTAVNEFYVFNNFISARYNADGSLDTSYGTNGVLSTFLGDRQSFLYSIVKSVLRQADGKFLVGLTRYEQNPGNPTFESYDFAVYRFNTNGEYDNNFGNAGKVFTSFFNKYDELFSMVLQDDHKIVLAGTTDNGVTRDFALVRLENCINVSAEVSLNLCAGDSYTVNDQTYTESGVYEATLTTAFGCDSLLTLNLTFDTLNTEISLSDNVFTALNIPQNAQLQWLNCDDNFNSISGETNPTFTAILDGNYALETSSVNCRDTSNCILFSSVGLNLISTSQFRVYPIPAYETLIVESELLNSTIRIFDAQGKLIFETITNSKRMEIDVRLFQSGLYFIQSERTSQPFTVMHSR